MILHPVHTKLKNLHLQYWHQCCHLIRSITWVLTLCMAKCWLRKNIVFLSKKKTERGQIKSESGYNFIASGVVTKIHCNLCNKQRCVFSSESYLSLSGEKYLEDDIYSCRMLLDSHNLCTQRNLHCISPIENAFYFKKEIAECISVHFGSLDVDVKAMIHLRKSFKNE